MSDENLKRFLDAQQQDYATALAEIKMGKKRTHWMWYIFPQIAGLGHSETTKYYSIKNKAEAEQYLAHPILGSRLIELCKVLLSIDATNATQVFDTPDDLKLRSSMTLFASVKNANPIFQSVLDKFFDGQNDMNTLRLIANE